MDSTCLKAAIHFPTDWVLLRDAAGTLMKATTHPQPRHLRAHGVTRELLARVNRLCMGMAAAGRKPGGKKQKKALLRQMKTLSRTIAAHARRHRSALDEGWAQTGWTRGQAGQILGRIDGMISQLPAAIRRAHERIIGERPVANADKLLSLCEGSLHVIVRGKAGAGVEVGNTLLLAENLDGIIVCHALLRGRSPNDTRLLEESITRIETLGIGRVLGIGTDRGFASRANRRLLEQKGIFDATSARPRRTRAAPP